MDFNQVNLGGTLTRDPELRHTQSGTAVTEVSIAINKRFTDGNGQKREEVTFVEVTFWGRTAENVAEYFRKGGQIFITGELKLDQWEDRNTGQKRSKLKVTGLGFQFLNKNEGAGGGGSDSMPRDEERGAPRGAPADTYDEDDDDIPF